MGHLKSPLKRKNARYLARCGEYAVFFEAMLPNASLQRALCMEKYDAGQEIRRNCALTLQMLLRGTVMGRTCVKHFHRIWIYVQIFPVSPSVKPIDTSTLHSSVPGSLRVDYRRFEFASSSSHSEHGRVFRRRLAVVVKKVVTVKRRLSTFARRCRVGFVNHTVSILQPCYAPPTEESSWLLVHA